MASLKIPARKMEEGPIEYKPRDRYPSSYLTEEAAKAVLDQGVQIGAEYQGTVRVRISGAHQSKSDNDTHTSVDIELLELTLDTNDKDDESAANALFGGK